MATKAKSGFKSLTVNKRDGRKGFCPICNERVEGLVQVRVQTTGLAPVYVTSTSLAFCEAHTVEVFGRLQDALLNGAKS